MAATVASGGVNPSTGEQVVDQVSCRCALVVMATAGLYETLGDWLYTIGLPGEKWHWRRDSDGVTRQGRVGYLRAAARCSRQ
jgi:hypothetical protein